MKLGIAILRATVGALMIGHGTQKLFGWFGGHGPDATGEAFESMGLGPGRRNALAAGASEAAGGASLVLGLLTPLGAAGLIGTMVTAIRAVHAERGPWVTEGGWEYNAALIASAVAIVDAGPGPWSLDAARGREHWGPGWALAALAAGAGGSALVIEEGKRRADRGRPAQAPGD
jgi:putative oxidoreductase